MIIRTGPVDLDVGLANPRLLVGENETRQLLVDLTRSGAWSAYGDLLVRQGDVVLAERRGLAVYPERDHITVALDLPSTASGPVTIHYSDRYLNEQVTSLQFNL